MASTAARQQPPWAAPHGQTAHPNLKVYNSLTRSKVPFLTQDPTGKRIAWYACGPTVYDDSHLGHARNYVSTDILRRILRDYFGFDIRFVMNITDVDDKIILAGRQQHLYHLFKESHRYIQKDVLNVVWKALQLYISEKLPLFDLEALVHPQNFQPEVQRAYGRVLRNQALDNDGKPGDKEAKVKMHINSCMNAVKALTADLKLYTPDAFYNLASDVMCSMLDEELGKTIKGDDHAIFTKLTKEFENRFFRDMRELNVMDPDEIVRVTEYGPQIAEFVDKIVKNQFAYVTSGGSVYFDIKAFENAGMPYARLEPWNRGDDALLADGEGALSQKTGEKKSKADFALWKASKPGEPSWASPWGGGRPGWHIECSAMASAKLGKQMDIHSGGIDLAFPHHDNELAQSEAYWQDGTGSQWVNYFLHMGHLSIAGSKMSKSLKNFTTIRTALDRGDWTPRSLRIVFLIGNWRDGVEITDDLVAAGAGWEDKVDNFFFNVREALKGTDGESLVSEPSLKWELKATEERVYGALCDSFNTSEVMMLISNLITKYNSADKSSLALEDIKSTALYVTKMVNIFGLNGSGRSTEVGWKGIDVPEDAKPFVYPLSAMRDQLREAARSQQSMSRAAVEAIVASHPPAVSTEEGFTRSSRPYAKALDNFGKSAVAAASSGENSISQENGSKSEKSSREILALCDRVRDVDLWSLNIYLEDRDSLPALVRPVTASLAAARKEKEDRAKAKLDSKRKKEAEEKEKLERAKISPRVMFKTGSYLEEFGEWDEEGLPTRLRDGTEVPRSRLKKLKKEWDRQVKAHEAWLEAHRGSGGETNGEVST